MRFAKTHQRLRDLVPPYAPGGHGIAPRAAVGRGGLGSRQGVVADELEAGLGEIVQPLDQGGIQPRLLLRASKAGGR